MKFFSVNTISKRTQDILVKNTIRKPSSVLKFMDENSGKLFITTDTERIFFKRNNQFEAFYQTYKNTTLFTVLEFVLHNIDEYERKLDSILLMIKRNLIKNNNPVLDYF